MPIFAYSLQHKTETMGFYCEKNGISVMAILNITPDSFFSGSRCNDADLLIAQAQKNIDEGADILDIGAVSTRPGAKPVSEEEELSRLLPALELLRKHFPDAVLSVDTYRASVAERCCKEFNISIVNDVTGGEDAEMFNTISELDVTYVLSHMQGDIFGKQEPHYADLIGDIHHYFTEKIDALHQLDVRSIILDPGFGFAKSIEQNFLLLRRLNMLQSFGLPILVGLSRKSMIYKSLGITAEDALNGTSVLNTLALTQGATLLRVHDVKEAKQVITLFNLYNQCSQV